MANTGYKGYSTLEQFYTDNGAATGVTKDNNPTDPDYISPNLDCSTCPQTTYSSPEITAWTQKNDCPNNYYGSQVLVTIPAGMFTSTISEQDALDQARNYFNENRQSMANSNGSCTLGNYFILGFDIMSGFEGSFDYKVLGANYEYESNGSQYYTITDGTNLTVILWIGSPPEGQSYIHGQLDLTNPTNPNLIGDTYASVNDVNMSYIYYVSMGNVNGTITVNNDQEEI